MINIGVDNLWVRDHFIVALEGNGNKIDPISSDSLHALLYINPDYIPDGHAKKSKNI